MRARSRPAWLRISPDLVHLKRAWSLRLLLTNQDPEAVRAPRSRRMRFEYNVVGVGLGEKFTSAKGQKTLCLRFLVRRKFTEKSLPLKHRLPASIEGLPTDIVEVGTPRSLSPNSSILHPPHGPIGPGCSVSFAPATPGDLSAGTVAAIVTDGTDNFILSANHVLADAGYVPIGTPVFHPGSLDRPAPQRVGVLAKVFPMNQGSPTRLDCALARLDPGVPWTSSIPDLGTPSPPILPYQGQYVSKYGRTTQRSDGQITNLLMDINVETRHGVYSMDDQIEVDSFGAPFATSGDSGSLVVDTYSRQAIGIVCSQAGPFTYISPINDIFSYFGVRFA